MTGRIRKKFIPVSVSDLIALETWAAKSDIPEDHTSVSEPDIITTTTTTVTTIVTKQKISSAAVSLAAANEATGHITITPTVSEKLDRDTGSPGPTDDGAAADSEKKAEKVKIEVTGDDEDEPSITLGLKVYTKRDCVVVITGKLPNDETEAAK